MKGGVGVTPSRGNARCGQEGVGARARQRRGRTRRHRVDAGPPGGKEQPSGSSSVQQSLLQLTTDDSLPEALDASRAVCHWNTRATAPIHACRPIVHLPLAHAWAQ